MRLRRRSARPNSGISRKSNAWRPGSAPPRAAIVSDDDAEKRARLEYGDDPEARERRELRAKVSMGAYIGSAQEQRGLEGAEAEYNAACGIRSGRFPLHLLAPEPEVRAETDASAKANQQTWIDRVFEQSMANALGITMKSVPAGVATFPVTTSGATGGQRARMEAKSADTWAVSAIELKPKRNTLALDLLSLEDSYRLPGLEEALRRDMRMAVMEAVDRAIFTSDSDGGWNGRGYHRLADSRERFGIDTHPGSQACYPLRRSRCSLISLTENMRLASPI